jgi:hypothetical protein
MKLENPNDNNPWNKGEVDKTNGLPQNRDIDAQSTQSQEAQHNELNNRDYEKEFLDFPVVYLKRVSHHFPLLLFVPKIIAKTR